VLSFAFERKGYREKENERDIQIVRETRERQKMKKLLLLPEVQLIKAV